MFYYFIKTNPTEKYQKFTRVLELMFEVGRILLAWQKGIGEGKIVIHMRTAPALPLQEGVGRREALPPTATTGKPS